MLKNVKISGFLDLINFENGFKNFPHVAPVFKKHLFFSVYHEIMCSLCAHTPPISLFVWNHYSSYHSFCHTVVNYFVLQAKFY